MRSRTPLVLLSCGIIGFAASSVSAQLVLGTTTPTTSNGAAFYLNVDTLQVTMLWNSAAQKKVNGMAYDPATGRIYCNDAARLNFWNQGSVGTVPTLIAGMYRTNDNVTFSATGVDGLAWAHGNLYGVTSMSGLTYVRGIYQIATVSDGMATPHCVMTPLWLDPTGSPGVSSGTVGLGGLEFNPDNNLFYFTQANDTTGAGGSYTPGIYTVNAFDGGELNKIKDFPAGAAPAHVDGLAIGRGKLWLTEQIATASVVRIYPLDLTTLEYESTLSIPLVDGTNRASGACWAPNALVPCKPGDLNNDGVVNGLDVQAYTRLKTTGAGSPVEHCAADSLSLEAFIALLVA